MDDLDHLLMEGGGLVCNPLATEEAPTWGTGRCIRKFAEGASSSAFPPAGTPVAFPATQHNSNSSNSSAVLWSGSGAHAFGSDGSTPTHLFRRHAGLGSSSGLPVLPAPSAAAAQPNVYQHHRHHHCQQQQQHHHHQRHHHHEHQHHHQQTIAGTINRNGSGGSGGSGATTTGKSPLGKRQRTTTTAAVANGSGTICTTYYEGGADALFNGGNPTPTPAPGGGGGCVPNPFAAGAAPPASAAAWPSRGHAVAVAPPAAGCGPQPWYYADAHAALPSAVRAGMPTTYMALPLAHGGAMPAPSARARTAELERLLAVERHAHASACRELEVAKLEASVMKQAVKELLLHSGAAKRRHLAAAAAARDGDASAAVRGDAVRGGAPVPATSQAPAWVGIGGNGGGSGDGDGVFDVAADIAAIAGAHTADGVAPLPHDGLVMVGE